MTSYLDAAGLAYFKTKQDAANEAKFLKNADFDQKINEKLVNVYRYKGTVTSFDLLPKEGNTAGDVYDVNGGMNYAWDGTKWDALGESKLEITIDSELKSDSDNPVKNKVIYGALAGKASVTEATMVTQTPSTSNTEYPILTKNTTQTDLIKDTTKFASGVTINPSASSITATAFIGKATEAAHADKATTADSATRATTADSAATATNADSAKNATYAETAGSANTATTAENAENATYASTAGSASQADTANTARKASSADSADDISFTVPIDKGGTGSTTAEDAWTALGGGSVGKLNTGNSSTTFLRNDGTWASPENTTYDAISNTEIDGLFS